MNNNRNMLQEAHERERTINNYNRTGFGFYAGYFTVMALRKLTSFIWAWRITTAWVVALLILSGFPKVAVLVLGVGLMVAAYWQPVCGKFAPVLADYKRRSVKKTAAQQRFDGQNFLVQAGIVSDQYIDDFNPDAVMVDMGDTLVLTVEALTGVPSATVAEKSKVFAPYLNAVRTSASKIQNGGTKITFFLTDPLDEGLTVDQAPALAPEKMSVVCARDALGKDQSITFGDSSGMVVGGIPGSGKTAGLTSFLLPLALSDDVDLSIIDGKGGEDWTNYEVASTKFIRGDEDLVPVRDFLKEHHAEMMDRMASNKRLLGTSNFWNGTPEQRRSAGLKFKLLVIDECQGIFETTGRTKEEKVILGEIYKYCSALVKRGRSAGFMTIFITQKPTNDSLPTGIRDNAGIRVAFHLTTSAAETAVLGSKPEDAVDMPSALAIPSSRKGGAVMASDTGEFQDVRFFYIPEDVQERLLQQTDIKQQVEQFDQVNEEF